MNPLETLEYPRVCTYPCCEDGPFYDAMSLDEHITEEHLAAAVWSFAHDNTEVA